MNEYLFYTSEGITYPPDMTTNIENCQVLGYSKGKDMSSALHSLLIDNPWIRESKFDVSRIVSVQILSQETKLVLRKLVDYLWKDEETHFEESGKPANHIFNILKRIDNLLV